MILVVPGYPVWVIDDKPRLNLSFLSLLTSGSSNTPWELPLQTISGAQHLTPPPSYYSRY